MRIPDHGLNSGYRVGLELRQRYKQSVAEDARHDPVEALTDKLKLV